MKKNILKATLVAAFALIAGFNVYNSQKSDAMSELALANVEALASNGESEGINWRGYYLDIDNSCCKIGRYFVVFRSVEQPKTIRNIQT